MGNDLYQSLDNFQNLNSGSYDFSVLDVNGCFADTSSSLYEPDIPIIFLGDDLDVDLGCEVLISASTNNIALTYINWTDLDNPLECDSCLTTYTTAVNDTEYVLTVTSNDDCSTSDSIMVTVNKIRDVYMPNAFSPNGDGKNNSFFVNANKSVSVIKSLKVFNRWGVLIQKNDLYNLKK